eukprot:9120673-Prorocentrum_lima.AAC.1
MTSSLVGSEMCIRDRCNECKKDKHGNKPNKEKHKTYQNGKNDNKDNKAVSYTHLTLPTICSV